MNVIGKDDITTDGPKIRGNPSVDQQFRGCIIREQWTTSFCANGQKIMIERKPDSIAGKCAGFLLWRGEPLRALRSLLIPRRGVAELRPPVACSLMLPPSDLPPLTFERACPGRAIGW